MSLFRRASQVRKKFKICMYGATGTGKTISALTFPKLAYIDMEGGTDWYIGREIVPGQNTDFELLQTESAIAVIKAIDEIDQRLKDEPGCIETVVIDPITVFWDALQDGFLRRLQKKKGENAEIKFSHWKQIKSPYKRALTKLINLPVHFIAIGREGVEYEMKGGELVQVGTKIQTEKDTPYISDIYIRFVKRDGKFLSIVEKDRTNMMREGTVIENLSFQYLMNLAEERGLVDSIQGARNTLIREDPDKVAEQDSSVFEEKKAPHHDLIHDEDIKKLWTELDWAPGKVRATIEKEGLNKREDLGKYLAGLVKAKRAESRV